MVNGQVEVNRRCPKCRRADVEWIRVPRYSSQYLYEGATYVVEVANLDLRQCTDPSCGSRMLDENADSILDSAAREVIGLLQPRLIAENRERLGFSRRELANAIGIEEAVLELYETGGQLTPRAMDRLLRKMFEYPEVRRVYGLDTVSLRNGLPATTSAVA
jgi:DNA-binding transcriptional regulator YiaG